MVVIDLKGLPPSSNKAYVNIAGKHRSLSATGRRYKNKVKTLVASKHRQDLLSILPNKPYALLIVLYTQNLFTKLYPHRARNRYKKFDVTNRAKLLEDALSEALGVDDSNNILVTILKVEAPEDKTSVYLWSLEDERSPIYDAAEACIGTELRAGTQEV